MELRRLLIERHYSKPIYEGTIMFAGDGGNISLTLDDEFSRRVFLLCADALVEHATRVATDMRATIIDAQLPQIEDKT